MKTSPRPNSTRDLPTRPTIWFDVGDFLEYFRYSPRPTGIQRVQIEIFAQAARHRWERGEIGFCRLLRHAEGFEAVEFQSLIRTVQDSASTEPGTRFWRIRRTLRRALRGSIGWSWRALPAGPETARFHPGDVLVCLGAAWENSRYARLIGRAHRDLGVRFAILIHDIIPLSHPQWVSAKLTRRFRRWLEGMMACADVVLTVSDCSRSMLKAYAAEHGMALPKVDVLKLGTGFRALDSDEVDAAAPAILPARFALCVSTVEARKNHRLLVHAWERLIERHGEERVPHLVFIGRRGWRSKSLMAELSASGFLGGKVTVLSGLSDAEVDSAYQRCLFTLFPSFVEGWGLPVAESLSHGKLCVASGRASLPEVGGELADYIDPTDDEGSLAVIERAVFDEAYRRAREARIRAEFRPRSWSESFGDLMANLDRLCGAGETPRNVPPARAATAASGAVASPQ
jgi:glycosyltransferase involved in cell wall biosynthesis